MEYYTTIIDNHVIYCCVCIYIYIYIYVLGAGSGLRIHGTRHCARGQPTMAFEAALHETPFMRASEMGVSRLGAFQGASRISCCSVP